MTLDLSVVKTLTHIMQVQRNLNEFAFELVERGIRHDASKLEPPEVEAFARLSGNLSQSEYNSDEYHSGIRQLDLNGALTHHYENNSHHPEHYSNGVNGMTLFDVVEMYCDWKAAVLRQKDGDLLKSIDANEERFKLAPQLAQILRNTVNAALNS